jgi:hypothetical protein
MKITGNVLALSVAASLAASLLAHAQPPGINQGHAVFLMMNGTLSTIAVNPSVGPGAFAVSFAPNGTAIVSQTGTTGAAAAISSYSVHTNGSLTALSASVPTLGAANCWNAITPNGWVCLPSTPMGR